MATSKEKRKPRSSSRVNIEDHNDKSSVKEIVSKIMRPYAFYLLTILKSYQLYGQLVNGSHEEEEAPFQWKLANWSHLIGGILRELIRLGRYFE